MNSINFTHFSKGLRQGPRYDDFLILGELCSFETSADARHIKGFNYEDFKSGSLHENHCSNLEFGNHRRICLKTGESNHACDKSRQTPTAIYMLISTLNPPLSSQMLSVTCIININKCRSNVLCMLQHKIRYLDVLEPKKPASDGCLSNEIYIYLVRPEGTEKTCSLRTADVT